MRYTTSSLVVLVALSCALMACKKSSIGPSPVDQPPDQSNYESLPARHTMLTIAGQDAGMWATFLSVTPARGSSIAKCNGSPCFTASVELCEDSDVHNRGESSGTFFSNDGVNPSGESIHERSIHPGACVVDNLGPGIFRDAPPKYILIIGQKAGSVDTKSSTSFLLDFKP